MRPSSYRANPPAPTRREALTVTKRGPLAVTRTLTWNRVGQSVNRPLRRLLGHAALRCAALALALAALISWCGGALLTSYGRAKVERAFTAANPGAALRIGKVNCWAGANRMVAQSVALSGANTTLKAGRISLAGVQWGRLVWGTAGLADVLAQAGFEATDVELEFPATHYRLRCARLRGSVPRSELLAEGIELKSLLDESEFFAEHTFRATRFHLVVPVCQVSGLAYAELLQGKAVRARTVAFSQPSFDASVDCDRPVPPLVRSPLLPNEALALLPIPLQLDSLRIINGHLAYRERTAAGAPPGLLTIATVNMSVEGIASQGDPPAAIRLQAQGELMGAGTLKVQMLMPLSARGLSLHYSGSLGGMDLTRLDAFLENAEHTRITSGTAKEASFDIDVSERRARGQVHGVYENLQLAILDKQTGDEKGLANRAASLLENTFKLRKSNPLEGSAEFKEGVVDYTRKPGDEFQQFLWFALRTGVLDLIKR